MNAGTVFWIAVLVCLAAPAAAMQPASAVTVFHIRDDRVTVVSSAIVYGGSPNHFLEDGTFIVTTGDTTGVYQEQAWIEDPRVRRILDFAEGEPSAMVRDDVDFTVILPFREDTAKVSVFDRERNLLAEADLSGARNVFCMAHPADERCRGTIGAWGIGALILCVIAGGVLYLLLKRRKTA